jgi:hypothetical protein
MNYLFRINVYDVGYSLYSYESGGALDLLPLGDRSSELLDHFSQGEAHLEQTLDLIANGPLLYASTWSSCGLVMFGYNIPVPDQFGREGIKIICGISGHRNELMDVVDRVMILNSEPKALEVQKAVAGIAAGSAEVTDLTRCFDDALPRWILPPQSPVKRGTPQLPIGGLIHDVAATELAWRAMIGSRQESKGSWTVFDQVDQRKPAVVVTRSPGSSQESFLLLSDYVRFAAAAANTQLRQHAAAAPAVVRPVETAGPHPLRKARRWSDQWPWVVGTIMMALTSAVLSMCLLTVLLSRVVLA